LRDGLWHTKNRHGAWHRGFVKEVIVLWSKSYFAVYDSGVLTWPNSRALGVLLLNGGILDTVASAPGCPQTTFVVKFRAEPLRQEGNTMFGPGEYRPDPSAGITAPADLPQPEIVPYSRNDLRQPCPRCGHQAYRDKQY